MTEIDTVQPLKGRVTKRLSACYPCRLPVLVPLELPLQRFRLLSKCHMQGHFFQSFMSYFPTYKLYHALVLEINASLRFRVSLC